jgi:hypothetical protein
VASERQSGMVSLTISCPPGLFERLEAFRKLTGRTMSVEVCHAIERHLAEPPSLATPPLSPARLDDVTPRRGRGRPKKAEE